MPPQMKKFNLEVPAVEFGQQMAVVLVLPALNLFGDLLGAGKLDEWMDGWMDG